MIKKLTLCISESLDPYYNMATERHLTETVGDDEVVLYLWRNQRTVVIGRNQNCWAECRVSTLEADGGHLARRLSGGGAVYHDAGNLNFTFAATTANYDVARQCSVIAAAVGRFGIQAEVSGRNDILAAGAKFSGNAFWCFGDRRYHHGTILIKTDTEAMSRYLSVPADKLKAKGVASVRSRVVNLSSLSEDINVDTMTSALAAAFGEVYGLPVSARPMPTDTVLAPIRAEFASPDWKYSRTPEFSHKISDRFPWGGITLELDVREGHVVDCEVFSDALDAEYIASLASRLRGCLYNARALSVALGSENAQSHDIAALLTREI